MSETKDKKSNSAAQINQPDSNGIQHVQQSAPVENGVGGTDHNNSAINLTISNGFVPVAQQNGNESDSPTLNTAPNHNHVPAPNPNGAANSAPPPPLPPTSLVGPNVNVAEQGQPTSPNGVPNQHPVYVHIDIGESLSLRGDMDQIEHVEGPAIVRMVSPNGIPIPMPIVGEEDQFISQVCDEYGILTHIFLSPKPDVPCNPMAGGPNSGSQYYHSSYGHGPTYSPQQYATHHHTNPGQTFIPAHLLSGVTIQTPPNPHTYNHAPVHSAVPSPPMSSTDDRAMRQRGRVKKKLERRRMDNYIPHNHSGPPYPPRRMNGDMYHPNAMAGGMSPTENGPVDSEEDNTMIIQYLSSIQLPKVTDVETRSALVKLTPPDMETAEFEFDIGDLKYELLLSDKGRDAKYKPVYNGDANEITLKDLKPATDYHLRVCSVLSEDLKGTLTEPISFCTQACEPDVPPLPKSYSINKNSISLKWNPSCDNGSKISTYTLECKQGDRFVEIYNGLQKQFRATKLQPATRYFYRLAAINSIGKSDFCEFSYSTKGTVPSQPDPPMLGQPFVYSLTISWIKRPNDDIFQLQMDDETSGHGFLSLYNGSDLSFTVRNLRQNSEYKFRLAAKNDEGVSKWSDVICFRTLPERPSVPAKPQIKGKVLSERFRITWDAPADDGGAVINKFIAELDEGNGFVTFYEGLEKEYQFDQLTPGHTYRIRVACCSSGGRSEMSDVCSVTTQPVVPSQCPPPKLQGKPKATSLHLRWSSPENNGGSQITCFTAQMISSDNSTREVYKGHDLDCIVAGLSPGRAYLFQVRAFNRIGCGPWSEPLEVVSGAGPPDTTKPPTVVCKTSHCAMINWEEPFNNGAEVTEYRLEWQYRSDQTEFSQLYVGPKCSYEAKGLIPDKLYTFRVQAINSAGAGAFSTHATCVTPPSSPASISTIRCTSTASSITLSWKEPSNNGSEIKAYNIDMGDKQITVDRVGEYTIDNLTPETTYRVRIQAENKIGVGPFSPLVKVSTKALPPSSPRLECAMVGSNSIKLKWGDGRNSDPLSYVLEMMKPDGTFSTLYVGPAQTYKINRLSEMTAYEFRIYACNEAGKGPYSENYTFSTTKAVPPVLRVPKVTSICLTGCVVEWVGCRPMGTDTIIYQLQMQCLNNVHENSYKEVYKGPNTFYTLDNLEPKTEYNVRVCAIRQGLLEDEDIVGPFSPGFTFCTQSPETIKPVSTRSTETKIVVKKPLSDQQKAMVIVVFFVIMGVLVAFILEKIFIT